MSPDRFSDQTILLEDGTTVKGKNVRKCSRELFELVLGGEGDSKTVGTARVEGMEIPVERTRGRKNWRQAGPGERYRASAFCW